MVVWVVVAREEPGPEFSFKVQGRKTRNSPDIQIHQRWYIYIVDYYSAVKKEQTAESHGHNMEESQKGCAALKPPDGNAYILYVSIYVKFKNGCSEPLVKNQNTGCLQERRELSSVTAGV